MIPVLVSLCLFAQGIEVEAGRKIPLTLLKSVSSKTAAPGDAVYLETVFPVMAGGKIVIPKGSHVQGSVVDVKRAGRVKGKAEMRVRLETLILPDGTSRPFRGTLGGVDPASEGTVDAEGKMIAKGDKLGDAKRVAQAAGLGAAVGGAAGGLATIGTTSNPNDPYGAVRRPAAGAGIGMLAGAAGMFVATLVMRGPDAVLVKGMDVDMVLETAMRFEGDAIVSTPENESGLKTRK